MDNHDKNAIAGICFLENTSTAHHAFLIHRNKAGHDDWQISVLDDAGQEIHQQTLDLSTLKISEPLANLPRNLYFDNHCFKIEAKDLPEALSQLMRHEKKWKLIALLETRWRWALASMAVLIASFVLFIEVGIPALAKPIAKLVPIEWKQELDKQTMTYLLNYGYLLDHADTDDEITKAKNNLQQLANKIPQSNEVIESILVYEANDRIGANAFALPGGTVIFTKQIFDIGLNDDELLAILAHEMVHVQENHSMRSIVQNMSLVILIGAYLGDVSFFSHLLLVSGPTLAQNAKYSRDFERESDNFAIETLKQLNIPTSCLGTGLAKLDNLYQMDNHLADASVNQGSDGDEAHMTKKEKAISALVTILSTHPSTEERIAAANVEPCD